MFEAQIELRRQGKIEDRVFAETRLRRGAYGQRYDNGQRNDGVATRALEYPSGELTKGPDTVWDAPGMLRIKIPYGGVTPEQLEVMAELAEEYSDEILHVTTRQDIQLHYIHIEDTPTIMRRLAAVGITTREACGNSVRNVTACPVAGVCRTEVFDVTGYADALTQFLLGHPDCQDFGRKFKIAFSGCADEACGLVRMHDFGALAKIKVIDGVERRGFELYVGGGLGHEPLPGEALLGVRPRRGAPPDGPGDCPRLRPARREAEPQPRPNQVPRREARHRRVHPARRGGAGDPAARPALDRLPPGRRALRRDPAAPARLTERPPAHRRGRPVDRHERLCSAPGGVRHRHRRAAARRHLVVADPAAGRHRPGVRGRHRALYGRAEHRAALGARVRPAGAATQRWPRSGLPRRGPARSSTSRRARAPTPASSASPRRAGSPASFASGLPRRRTSSTRPSAACGSR